MIDDFLSKMIGATQISQGQTEKFDVNFNALSSSATLYLVSSSHGGSVYVGPVLTPSYIFTLENVVTTVCPDDYYRYGHDGMQKVNEYAGYGNHYTSLYGEMVPQRGGRDNPDPVTHPWESPYATYDNNPIWKSDPRGNSGEAFMTNNINKITGHPIIKVVSDIHLYGQDATPERANTIQSDLNRLYNNSGNYFTTEINGKLYDVQFDFKADVITDADATKGIGNLSAKDNYYEVRNDISASRTLDGVNGGNTCALKTDDIDNGKKSDAHEANHGFGGQNKDLTATQNDVNPDIATPQEKTTIPGKRTVTQDNINAIFKNVTFDKSGKANVGNPRPQKFDIASPDEDKDVPVNK